MQRFEEEKRNAFVKRAMVEIAGHWEGIKENTLLMIADLILRANDKQARLTITRKDSAAARSQLVSSAASSIHGNVNSRRMRRPTFLITAVLYHANQI